jgi:hypothetical protein
VSQPPPEYHLRHVATEGAEEPCEIYALGDEPAAQDVGRRRFLLAISLMAMRVGQGEADGDEPVLRRGGRGAAKGTKAAGTEAPTPAARARAQPKANQWVVAAHQSAVTALAVSPNQYFLATASKDRTIKLWDMPGGLLRRRFFKQDAEVRALAFPAADRIWSVRATGHSIRVRALPSGRPRGPILGEREFGRCAAITPNGTTLAVAAAGDRIQLWDIMKTGKLRRELDCPSPVVALALSHEGKLIAIADAKGSIRAEFLEDGRSLGERNERPAPFTAVAVAPQPATLAWARGKDIHVEPLDREEPAFELSGQHRFPITALAFAPDGQYLVSGDADGVVIIWDLATKSALSYLFDPAVSAGDATAFQVKGSRVSTHLVFTLPCGSPTPPGATCLCNCVPGVVTQIAMETERQGEVVRQLEQAELQRQLMYLEYIRRNMSFTPYTSRGDNYTSSSRTICTCNLVYR